MSEKSNTDQGLASRKQDHIKMALESQVSANEIDARFYYEPLLSGHPIDVDLSKTCLGKTFQYPVWVSSMTGGTERAKHINENLARLCAEFNLGMGLGSCRALLESKKRFSDFDLRPILGMDRPFYANLGIAQIETLCDEKSEEKIEEMISALNADGLIIHINPLQEWAQPEGDRIARPPIETITKLCDEINVPIIVKEVGQGMGPASLAALLKLPLVAVEFGASGGTNFTKLELSRAEEDLDYKNRFSHVGHSAAEMVSFVNDIVISSEVQCKDVIISGGVRNYLQGYYLMNSCKANSIYGQASTFLRFALGTYEELKSYFVAEMEGLAMATAFLHLKDRPV